MQKKLRPYQIQALESTRRLLQQYDSTVVVLPTGLGKTVYAAKLIAEWEQGNALFLAHTRELIAQSADKLGHEIGYKPVIEMNIEGADPESLYQGGLVVVGSVQSMVSDRRLEKYRRHGFGLIVVDECFPSGTIVDGRPIETIRIGDEVTAFDEHTGQTIRRRVTRLFRQMAPCVLIEISAGGKSVFATPNHPFFTSRGWVHAGDIKMGDDVYGLFADVRPETRRSTAELQKRAESLLVQSSVSRTMEVPASGSRLRGLRETFYGSHQAAPLETKQGTACVLLSGMHTRSVQSHISSEYGRHESEVCVGSNEAEQSYDAAGNTGKGLGHNEGGRTHADRPWRERPRDDGSRTHAVGCGRPIPAHCHHRSNRRIPDALQTGLGGQFTEDGRGSGWAESFVTESPGSRRKETGLLGVARVDRVEIHERRGDGQFDEVCRDGFVYNLEVEGNHTYLANGFAVHNCHHATSASYRKVIDFYREINPGCKIVGITATPNRSDGAALGIVFESVAYQVTIEDAINGGWLVPIRQEVVTVEGLDFTGLSVKKNTLGEQDFSPTQLEAVLMEEENLHGMAMATLEKLGDRKAIIFTAGVEQARLLSDVLNRYKPNSAKHVSGETEKEERKKTLEDFANGHLQFVANCQVLTEGFDSPTCSAIVMGRPTKSLSLYIQMLGRGLRPLAGVADGHATDFDRRMAILTSEKSNCLVLDFAGVSNHKLVDALDVLGGSYDVETRELVRREAAEGQKNIAEILELAKHLAGLRVQSREREAIKAQAVKYQSYETNPFGDGQSYSAPVGDGRRGGASDKQIGLLVALGVKYEVASGYTKKQAGAVIDSMGSSRCTERQARVLAKHGIPTAGIGIERASRIIDAIASNGWKRPEVIPE